MNRPLVVVQAFFYKNDAIPKEPEFIWKDKDEFIGFKLWKPNGHPVFVWAIDYVSCNDERWCAFGPFQETEAREVLSKLILKPGCDGARIVNVHCFETLMKKPAYNRLPQWAWTDG